MGQSNERHVILAKWDNLTKNLSLLLNGKVSQRTCHSFKMGQSHDRLVNLSKFQNGRVSRKNCNSCKMGLPHERNIFDSGFHLAGFHSAKVF